MTADSSLWSTLIDLNKAADSLIDRARKRIEPSPPVSRELLTDASIEVRFDNLPTGINATPPTNSDSVWGNNVKRGFWTNGASRLYLRELAFERYYVDPSTNSRRLFYAPYFRWNFQTSITQKQYADKRVSMLAGGRSETGNHLSFRDPLVVEPMETFTFECELLSFGQPVFESTLASFVVACYLSGYREGM